MNSNQHGFSLLEMMVVIAMIATLSAGGFYGWQRWQQRLELWQTAQQLRHFLIRLRNNANGNNQTHLLTLHQRGTHWCLSGESRQTEGCQKNAALLFTPAFTGIAVEEMTQGLGFYGARSTAWPGHIVLAGQAGKWKVTVSVWGRVRLCALSGKTSC